MKDLRSISFDEAFRLVQAAIHTPGKPVAVCVLDARGVQLAALCADGATEGNVRTARAKCVSVLEFQRHTVEFHFEFDSERACWVPKDIDWPARNVVNASAINPTFSSFAGGVAIREETFGQPLGQGPILGAIAVSGRPELEDHDAAWQAIGRVFS